MIPTSFVAVGDAARILAAELGRAVPPRDVSDLLYQHPELTDRCTLAAGRRLVPRELLPELRKLLLTKRREKAASEGVQQ
jgi:hypothetical protein